MGTPRLARRLLDYVAGTLAFVPLALAPAGCASLPGTASESKSRTFLAIGEKPLPVVTGEPGAAVSAGATDSPAASMRRAARDARISGRVYDADGRPIPGARVRLAVGAASGGKVVSASTDRSGGFTLHGLRPGSAYTLVAESGNDDGPMIGRATARASETNVRITLTPRDVAPGRASAPARVNRVSDRAVEERDQGEDASDAAGVIKPADSASEPETRSNARSRVDVNEEDLPPAAEAEALAPPPESSPRSRAATPSRRPRVPAPLGPSETWRRRAAERGGAQPSRTAEPVKEAPPDPTGSEPAPAPAPDTATASASEENQSRGTSADGTPTGSPNDDVPNPLPPAIEPGEGQGQDQARAVFPVAPPPGEWPLSRSDELAGEPPRRVSDGSRVRDESTRRSVASSTFEVARPSESPVRTAPWTTEAGSSALPATFAPFVLHKDAPPAMPPALEEDPFAGPDAAPTPDPGVSGTPSGRPKPRSEMVSKTAPRARTERTHATTAGAPGPRTADTGPRRPTWGELTAGNGDLPPLEGQATSDSLGPIVTRLSAAEARRRAPAGRDAPARAVPRQGSARTEPVCEYDERHRRILDFRLPDLDGRPVRFHDLDADLVLLDFWGTWCEPCLRSTPHLVELQQRTEGKRLKVVGIACEQDGPETSAARVSAAARKLNINYPVLLSRNDGSCPLQEALHVSALPTMVLVDRQGRVLWRDQGATAATLARLDRILATAPGETETRRY